MDENKIIITVSGADKVGIVAGITAVLANIKVNIVLLFSEQEAYRESARHIQRLTA